MTLTNLDKADVESAKALLSMTIDRGCQLLWPSNVAIALRELADECDQEARELQREIERGTE